MSETLLTEVQADVAARLNADSYFSDITVAIEDKQDIQATVNEKLVTLTTKDGNLGIGVVVEMLTANDNLPNIPFGPLNLNIVFLVIENRIINQATTGTLKEALAVARRIHRIMKLYRPGGLTNPFAPIDPVITFVRELLPLVAYEVGFVSQEADDQTDLKVAPVIITRAAGTVTMTTATVGAAIYYNDNGGDGSIPTHPWVDDGTLFVAPFMISNGHILRATGHLAGSIESDVTQFTTDASTE